METPTTPPSYQPAPNPILPPVQVPPTEMPPAKPTSSMRVVWMVLIGVVVLAGAAYGWMKIYPSSPVAYQTPTPLLSASPSGVACTEEAKICPDGSAVGRTGTNCEFTECPSATSDETADWKTYTNTQYGFEFKYPNNFVVDTEKTVYSVLGSVLSVHKASDAGYVSNGLVLSDSEGSSVDANAPFATQFTQQITRIRLQFGAKVIYAQCGDDLSNIPLCNQILSTFEFTK